MKKKITAFACLLLSMLMCLCGLVGCGGAKYRAKLYSHAQAWASEEFLKEHHVYGATYRNEDYIEGVSNSNEEYIQDRTSPHTHIVIIKTQEEYESIFPQSTVEVDFEKQLIVTYTFCDLLARDYLLKKMSLENQKLTVVYKPENIGNRADTCEPYQRCFMLVMNQAEFDTVEFIKKKIIKFGGTYEKTQNP